MQAVAASGFEIPESDSSENASEISADSRQSVRIIRPVSIKGGDLPQQSQESGSFVVWQDQGNQNQEGWEKNQCWVDSNQPEGELNQEIWEENQQVWEEHQIAGGDKNEAQRRNLVNQSLIAWEGEDSIEKASLEGDRFRQTVPREIPVSASFVSSTGAQGFCRPEVCHQENSFFLEPARHLN